MVQYLKCYTSTAGDTGLTSGQGTKVRDTAFDCIDPIDQMEERPGSMMILSYPVYGQSVSLFICILFKLTMN